MLALMGGVVVGSQQIAGTDCWGRNRMNNYDNIDGDNSILIY
jgi:hypothetical protein